MSKIIIDWGTSCFRAYHVDDKGFVIDELSSAEGAAQINARRAQGCAMPDGAFARYLTEATAHWKFERGVTEHLLVGMVGSSIGWQNVPALGCPASIDTVKQSLVKLSFSSPAYLVRGLSCTNQWDNPDFMRGEESQIFGWWLTAGRPKECFLLSLPGTHTKWALVENGEVRFFSTAMSGEAYQLLTDHSILASESQSFDHTSFETGLAMASKSNDLLHQLFSCRSKVLVGDIDGRVHHSYLSGLLLGTEVESLYRASPQFKGLPVAIIGNTALVKLYHSAIKAHADSTTVMTYDAKQCLINFALGLEHL